MKTFAKRLGISCGVLLGAALCMGIVYIDSINHYWRVGGDSGSYVQLIVSNKLVLGVNTNTGRIGINSSNQNSVSVDVVGLHAATNLTGNGGSASTSGRIRMTGGAGGASFLTTTASGGTGGAIQMTSGAGGEVPFATTNATGGAGGSVFITGATGGSGSLATNSITGGAGGGIVAQAGAGGTSSFATTQAVSGAGGSFTIIGGSSSAPSGGWSRKTSDGGAVAISAGGAGDSVRTNSGAGGNVTINAGSSGDVTTAPGDPGAAGYVEILGGRGGSGGTNANGGALYLSGGTGAITGPIIIGVTASGTVRGGSVGISTNNPRAKLHVAGDVALTGAAQPVYFATTATNNVLQTNWLGIVQAAAASVLEAAFNQFSELVVTQRISAATTITLTNGSPAYASMSITVLGEASGGSSRNVTLVANTGQLIANLDVATALATSYTFALPAGNGVEISDEIRQLNGTNVHKIITRQFTF